MLKISHSSPLKPLFLFVMLLTIITAGICYWIHIKRFLSTENAYLNANIIQIAPRLTGPVNHLYIHNNQFVHRGDMLLELDPAPFIIAVKKAKATLAIDEANFKDAEAAALRTAILVKKKTLSAQTGDDALAKVQAAEAQVNLSKANLAQAELDLQYTRVVAPTSGWVTNMSLQPGNIIEANQPLFALISDAGFWVDANFKETELANIKPGQKATIKTDMHPDHLFAGIVESISRGSGSVFSLLPPQNATGNWVKITQRVPVRVRVLNPDARYALYIGTTATVTVDTKSIN